MLFVVPGTCTPRCKLSSKDDMDLGGEDEEGQEEEPGSLDWRSGSQRRGVLPLDGVSKNSPSTVCAKIPQHYAYSTDPFSLAARILTTLPPQFGQRYGKLPCRRFAAGSSWFEFGFGVCGWDASSPTAGLRIRCPCKIAERGQENGEHPHASRLDCVQASSSCCWYQLHKPPPKLVSHSTDAEKNLNNLAESA